MEFDACSFYKRLQIEDFSSDLKTLLGLTTELCLPVLSGNLTFGQIERVETLFPI